MFALEYRKSMASARPKFRQAGDAQTFDMQEAKRLRASREQQAVAIREARLAMQRREVAEMMERGRAAARRFRAFDYDEGELYRPSFDVIERRLCRLFKINRTELRSKRRDKRVVFARQAVMYWASRLTLLSLPEIGRMMGGMDHTTVIHGKNAYRKKRAMTGRKLRDAG